MSSVHLDSPPTYAQLDPDDMYRRVDDLAGQLEAAWDISSTLKLPDEYRSVNNILVVGMGGSAIGGSLLQALAAQHIPIPLSVWRGYGLPAWVNQNTLVVAVSYSGNTEETLSALHAARARAAKIVVLSTGGEILRLAMEWDVPRVTFDYAAQPRATLGYLLTPLIRLVQVLGFVPDQEQDMQEAIATSRLAHASWGAQTPTAHNLAKGLAHTLHDRLVVVYGAEFLEAVARRWKTQLNENSKMWAFYEEYSELDHNAIVGYRFPAGLARYAHVVTLVSPHLSTRIQKRMQVTEGIMDRYGVAHTRVQGDGTSKLAQMLSLVALGDYVTYYLALLNDADPTEIEPINILKDALAKD